jgi:hypothetical protein
MVFSVHLQRLAVVAIVICHDHSQFIGFRSLKPAAPQWIWLFQEALLSALSKSQSESFTSSQGFKPYPQLNRFQPA